MTAVETVLRYAAGGGLHASLILLLPFEVSSATPPPTAFLFFVIAFLYILVVTAICGILSYRIFGGDRLREDPRAKLKAIGLTSAVSGFHYALLPASLVLTEGMNVGVAMAILVAFFLGFTFNFSSLFVAQLKAVRMRLVWCFFTVPLVLIIWFSLVN